MSRSPLTGRTILITRPAERSARLVKLLDQRGARAIVAPTIALRPVHVSYVGFKIPDEFVVGFGLDYAEKYRNLDDICVLDDSSEGGSNGGKNRDMMG